MGLLLALTAVASVAAGVNAQCTSLADAATAAGLTGLLDTIGGVADDDATAPLLEIAMSQEPVETPITLFAPTNEAFAEIAGVVAGLDSELVLAVLLNHILPTEEDAATLVATAPADVSTLLGTVLSTSVVGEDLIVTPASTTIAGKVVTTDVATCAGIVHVVDKVLVPVVEAAEAPESFAPGPTTTKDFVAEGPDSIAFAPEPVVIGEYGDDLDAGYGL